MYLAIAVFVGNLLIFSFEFLRIKKRGLRRDVIAFSFFMLIATALSISKAIKIQIYNPLDLIAFLYEPLGKLIIELFK